MCCFLPLSTWRRLTHWRQKKKKKKKSAVQQANSCNDRPNWIRENKQKTTWMTHTKISIPQRFFLPAGRKRWRKNEGETEVKHQEKSRIWAPLIPPFPLRVRLVYQRGCWTALWVTEEWGLWKEKQPSIWWYKWQVSHLPVPDKNWRSLSKG